MVEVISMTWNIVSVWVGICNSIEIWDKTIMYGSTGRKNTVGARNIALTLIIIIYIFVQTTYMTVRCKCASKRGTLTPYSHV